ncbi:hypothetical protein C0991_001237 [Blastosporella zonata]|nr:hypothetical protein C0991_001237 [Blastosporella zonata]
MDEDRLIKARLLYMESKCLLTRPFVRAPTTSAQNYLCELHIDCVICKPYRMLWLPKRALRKPTSATVIPSLSLGLSLSSRFLPPDQLDSFMRRMLVSRISRRVLAEHHIALSEIHAGTHAESSGEPHVGIIFTGLNVRRSIERCVKLLKARPVGTEDHYGDGVLGAGWPEVTIDGHVDTKFAYIREHLE